MVMVDLFCESCGCIVPDKMVDTSETEHGECPKCSGVLKRRVGCTSFELKYDNRKDICDWKGNTTRYWDEVKKTGGDEPANPRQRRWE